MDKWILYEDYSVPSDYIYGFENESDYDEENEIYYEEEDDD